MIKNYSKLIHRMNQMMPMIILAIIAIVSCGLATAATVKMQLNFNEMDFSYSFDSDRNLVVTCSKINATQTAPGFPALPLISQNVLLKKNQKFVSYNVTAYKRLVNRGIALAKSQPMASTDIPSRDPNGPYDGPYLLDFPDSICMLTAESTAGGFPLLSFMISPYSYEQKVGALYFTYRVNLEINVDEIETSTGNTGLVINPEVLKFPDVISKLDTTMVVLDNRRFDNPIDYLLITNNNLSESFDTLLNWKHSKGIRVARETVESIGLTYDGADLVEKIKRCIYDYYKDNGVRYVLLGGDTEIVPTRYCRIGNYDKDNPDYNNIPSDIYYACFDGDFTWNSNKNEVYGEYEDGVNLMEYVFVTRLPVNTKTDAENVSLKIVESEKAPIWNGDMLMTGSNLDKKGKTEYAKRDAEGYGDMLYHDYIEGKLCGNMIKYYDCNSDFRGGADYDLTPNGLQNEFNRGYSFVEFIGHGAPCGWYLENDALFTSLNNVAKINSRSNTTIISTMSCSTNYFDWDENKGYGPCLSETFIRNINSGVVAYWGCSRSGYFTSGYPYVYGSSLGYDAAFYDKLFSDKLTNKNFGRVCTLAKLSKFGSANITKHNKYSNWNIHRWVHYGINPVGDPEMPVFTQTPRSFDNANVSFNPIRRPGSQYFGETVIDTGEDNCRVCIMSESDNGQRYYKIYDDVRYVRIDGILGGCVATITKQNFIPKQLKTYFSSSTGTMPVGKIVKVGQSGSSNVVEMDVQLPEYANDSYIVLSDTESGAQQVSKIENVSDADNVKIRMEIEQASKPVVRVASLLVNGEIHDSVNIIK